MGDAQVQAIRLDSIHCLPESVKCIFIVIQTPDKHCFNPKTAVVGSLEALDSFDDLTDSKRSMGTIYLPVRSLISRVKRR